MVEEHYDKLVHHSFIIPLLFVLFLIFSGTITKADAQTEEAGSDRVILLNLKSFLEEKNKVNRGKYADWNKFSSDHCNWSGVACNPGTRRVTRIDLSKSSLNGEISGNFSGLSELSSVDLSGNTLSVIPSDLSHNTLKGELNLTGLSSLEVLDLSLNSIGGEIRASFPAICSNLRVLNISTNNFTGTIDGCSKLEYVDLSANNFYGKVWPDFSRLKAFDVGENEFSGLIVPELFEGNCSLETLDLSENNFTDEISKCKNLSTLILGGNNFTGSVPDTLCSILISKVRVWNKVVYVASLWL